VKRYFLIVILSQVIAYQFFSILFLNQRLEVLKESSRIERSQINDLVNQLSALREESLKSYVKGLVIGINKKDYISDVWHDGYSHAINDTMKELTWTNKSE
jgi:hypothetical protein